MDTLKQLEERSLVAEARNEALLQALKKYGLHSMECNYHHGWGDKHCDCGLDEILDSGSASQEAKTPGGPIPSPELQALLEKTRHRAMTPEDQEAQRRSWARGEAALGTDADEARERAAIREIKEAAKGKEK